jgi:hypothetical protein
VKISDTLVNNNLQKVQNHLLEAAEQTELINNQSEQIYHLRLAIDSQNEIIKHLVAVLSGKEL